MKLYIGNLGDDSDIRSEDLRPLFEKFGTVTECERIKNYAFVHIEEEEAGNKAVLELDGYRVKGRRIKVEKSENKGPRKPSIKLFVGNIKEGTTNEELRAIFEKQAPVLEADVVKNYGFVHLDSSVSKDKVQGILRELNGYCLNGQDLRVQLSTSSGKSVAGGGKQDRWRDFGNGFGPRNRFPDDRRGRRDPFGPPRGAFRRGGGGPMRGGVNFRGPSSDPYPPFMRDRFGRNFDGFGDGPGPSAGPMPGGFYPPGPNPFDSNYPGPPSFENGPEPSFSGRPHFPTPSRGGFGPGPSYPGMAFDSMNGRMGPGPRSDELFNRRGDAGSFSGGPQSGQMASRMPPQSNPSAPGYQQTMYSNMPEHSGYSTPGTCNRGPSGVSRPNPYAAPMSARGSFDGAPSRGGYMGGAESTNMFSRRSPDMGGSFQSDGFAGFSGGPGFGFDDGSFGVSAPGMRGGGQMRGSVRGGDRGFFRGSRGRGAPGPKRGFAGF